MPLYRVLEEGLEPYPKRVYSVHKKAVALVFMRRETE